MTPQFKKWKKPKIILPSLRTLSTQIPGKDIPLWYFITTVVDFITKTWFVLVFFNRECSRQGNVNTAFNLEDDDGKWQPDV